MTFKEVIFMEQWLPCREFPAYEVSDAGRIRNIKTERILRTYINEKGYEIVCLRKDGRQHTVKVHRLVASAFCDQYYEGLDVTHVDRNRSHNHAHNLEWRFRSDISRRSFRRYGRKPRRAGKKIRVLETGEVVLSIEECAKALGLSRPVVSKCVNYPYLENRYGYHFILLDD
jgi:hypothetical protein